MAPEILSLRGALLCLIEPTLQRGASVVVGRWFHDVAELLKRPD